MFLNIFNISQKVIRTSIAKKMDGNLFADDLRGKTTSHVKYYSNTLDAVKEYIKKFPVMESCFCIEGTKRQYLASNLNITKMYEFFVKENPNTEIQEHYYRKVLNENFNLGFHQPEKDQCDVCLEYRNTVDKTQLQQKHDNHINSKNETRKLNTEIKELASTDDTILAAAFNLQKVLPVPFGEHSYFFYKLMILQ